MPSADELFDGSDAHLLPTDAPQCKTFCKLYAEAMVNKKYFDERCTLCKEVDENIQDKLAKIVQWIEAYPLEVFPEPDLKKAAKVLKENGMTLDAISASNMRHVLNGIKAIIEA